jgi:DNA-binding transcriptional LysR family regulator
VARHALVWAQRRSGSVSGTPGDPVKAIRARNAINSAAGWASTRFRMARPLCGVSRRDGRAKTVGGRDAALVFLSSQDLLTEVGRPATTAPPCLRLRSGEPPLDRYPKICSPFAHRPHPSREDRASAVRSQLHGRGPRVIGTRTWRLTDLGSKHMLLKEGIGWGYMPQHTVREDIEKGRSSAR